MYAILAIVTAFEPIPKSKDIQNTSVEVANTAVIRIGDTFSLQLAQMERNNKFLGS
jgi:hypothetical protein